MADNFVQTPASAGTGTTTASQTLNGVTAGNTLVAFAFTGSSTTPTTHSVADGQGAYTPVGSPITDSTNSTWGQAFVLANASAGTHVPVATFDSGLGVAIVCVEIGTSAGSSSFSGANGANQISPGAGANVLSSGSVTVSGTSTLVCVSVDVSTLNISDVPTTGTSPLTFTSRLATAVSGLGSLLMETVSAASASAGTAGPVITTDNFITIAVAILNAAGGGGGGGTNIMGRNIWMTS